MTRLYAALAVLVVLVGALIGASAWLDHKEAAAYRGGYAAAEAAMKDRENKALTTALAEKAALEVQLQGIAHEAAVEKENAAVAADRAVVAGDRLRLAESALRHRAQCPAAPAAGGASADAAGNLLDEVQRRLDGAATELARYGDEARIAGLACERAYDALK